VLKKSERGVKNGVRGARQVERKIEKLFYDSKKKTMLSMFYAITWPS
jgi:hypothetical protein